MQASAFERLALTARLPALGLLLLALPAAGADVGAGDRARPGLHRVGVAEPGRPGSVSVAGDVSAGVTESLADGDAAHERVAARAAATVDATRWLNFGAWVGGRYDRHARDAEGRDDGLVFQSELSTRLAWRAGALG